ncbi:MULTISPECIES: winged helix-turn-helix domain-containing protein [sulfur-oxidizing symbionts]|uniref:OmpR/PhoB-type domain-containing protein n=1 Tax=endosymbiont of Riftia pachyptila (vent Ph05) TaxID=1048808 RepID=G2DHP6_9GAMM|nr:hypothetical protein Rifp1Sym_fn00050 [endosymbiont of Riftia pachyptila (vent Ph05)]
MIVSDDALTQVIIKLRKALGDDAKHPRYIQTISKHGYRLITQVENLPLKAPPADRCKKRVSWLPQRPNQGHHPGAVTRSDLYRGRTRQS